MKFIYVTLALLATLPDSARAVEEIPADLRLERCEEGLCLSVHFMNRRESNVCIKNTLFPYDGELKEMPLDLYEANGRRVETKLIEPSLVSHSSLAKLVRLVPPGATASTTIRLGDYFDLLDSISYTVTYTARAYFCSAFQSQNDYFVLKGVRRFSR